MHFISGYEGAYKTKEGLITNVGNGDYSQGSEGGLNVGQGRGAYD